jgi:hypothetical protein
MPISSSRAGRAKIVVADGTTTALMLPAATLLAKAMRAKRRRVNLRGIRILPMDVDQQR